MKRLKRITFNVKAWSPIMTDEKVIAKLREAGEAIAAEASGYVTESDPPGEVHFAVQDNVTNGRPQRARVVVIAVSREANEAEIDRAALTRSLDAGRTV